MAVEWTNITEIVVSIILGGGGIVGIALSIGKRIAEKMVDDLDRKKQFKIDKELEKYKNELDNKLKEIQSLIDMSEHAFKIEYDNEFQTYLEIWEKMQKCVGYMMRMDNCAYVTVNPEIDRECIKDDYEDYSKAYMEFENTLLKYSLLCKQKMCDDFAEVKYLLVCDLRECKTIIVKDRYSEKFIDMHTAYKTLVGDVVIKLRLEIRDYLDNIQNKKKEANKKYEEHSCMHKYVTWNIENLLENKTTAIERSEKCKWNIHCSGANIPSEIKEEFDKFIEKCTTDFIHFR